MLARPPFTLISAQNVSRSLNPDDASAKEDETSVGTVALVEASEAWTWRPVDWSKREIEAVPALLLSTASRVQGLPAASWLNAELFFCQTAYHPGSPCV